MSAPLAGVEATSRADAARKVPETRLDPAPARDRPHIGSVRPRIYFASTSHRRNSNAPGAVARTFRYTTCYWLVDVDDLPVLPRALRPFTRFQARDHLGDPDAVDR